MTEPPDKKWSSEYIESTTMQKVDLSENERKIKLENSIELLKSMQNELVDLRDSEPYPKILDTALSQLILDLEAVKNGYMVI